VTKTACLDGLIVDVRARLWKVWSSNPSPVKSNTALQMFMVSRRR